MSNLKVLAIKNIVLGPNRLSVLPVILGLCSFSSPDSLILLRNYMGNPLNYPLFCCQIKAKNKSRHHHLLEQWLWMVWCS